MSLFASLGDTRLSAAKITKKNGINNLSASNGNIEIKQYYIDDLGNKNIKYNWHLHTEREMPSNNNNKLATIYFSSDILQFLISNGKFSLLSSDTKSGATSDNKIVYKLGMNDAQLPILFNINTQKHTTPRLIANIRIKNLFDSMDFLLHKQKLQVRNGAGVSSEIFTIGDYNKYIEDSRKYYKNRLSKLLQDLYLEPDPVTRTRNGGTYDLCSGFHHFPLPCSTDYGFDVSQYVRGLLPDYTKNDFIPDICDVYWYVCDLIRSYYDEEYKFSKRKKINTIFCNENGEKHDHIIVDDTILIGEDEYPETKSIGASRKYVIIGSKDHINSIVDSEFLKYANNENTSPTGTPIIKHNDIIEEQRTQYESWLKEYTWQELSEKITKRELSSEELARLTSSDKIEFADYILNKKKIAGVDFKYIKNMNLLNPEQMIDMKKYLGEKVNKMCRNKFNKPNTKLTYKWYIMIVSFDVNGKPIDITPAINTYREINSIHTKLFKHVQKLSWTEMLYKNNILAADETNDDFEFKQVFTELNFDETFNLISNYLHPLDYKIGYYYRENKTMTIEELIECSSLMCDGQFPGMDKYAGLPFFAVVPVNIINYCWILNSSLFFEGMYENCTVLQKYFELRSNITATKNSKRNKRLSKWKLNSNKKSKRSNNANNDSKVSNTEPNKVLDKTIYINSDGKYINITNPETLVSKLTSLFANSVIKVYSTMITANGLLVCTLFDSVSKRFYYVLLEIDIHNLKASETVILEKQYNEVKNRKCIWGLKPQVPLINIYLVKEFTPGDKIFNTLGNECIYKLFSEQHQFFTKPEITLNYDDGTVKTIPNFYGYMLISIINKLNPIKDVLKRALDETLEMNNSEEPRRYYRIKLLTGELKMVSEDELISKNLEGHINSKGIIDDKGRNNKGNPVPRDDTLKIDTELYTNNTIFMTVGKNYIMLMNKFYEDELKTGFIPANKQQLKNHYKFTLWALTREYVQKCLDILESDSRVNINKINDIATLYRLTSLSDGNLLEIDNHIQKHNEFTKKYIINKSTYICKDYNPIIHINPSSDISSSIMHLHFITNTIHEISWKIINIKYELLQSNSGYLFYIPLSNSYIINKLMNKFKTNKTQTINSSFMNPYNAAIKLSYILQYPIS